MQQQSPFELTLEQQFHIRLMEDCAQQLTREQMQDLLIQTTRLLMLKENFIRCALKTGKL